MTLTREQRIEAYTYALFCVLAGWSGLDYWGSINDWETNEFLSYCDSSCYTELDSIELQEESYSQRISALCRAIEECEKSKA